MSHYDELFAQDRAHFMHPSTHAHDHASGALKGRIITGASGIRIRDHEGRELLDAFAGLYCVNIGYGRTEVAEAIYKQAKELAYYHTYVGHSTEAIIELSARIIDWAPKGMKKVYYGLSGSDANETQIKLVRYYNNVLGRPAKKKIISRQRGYHGSGIMTGSLTGLASFHQHFDLPHADIKHAACPHFYKAPAGMDEAAFVRHCAEDLERLILAEGPETVAAFIGEPVMGTGGIIVPPTGYWEAIQAVLAKYDILLIADEVICGFGRTGEWFGQQYFGFQADIMAIAKGLSSGYIPIGAVMFNDRVANVLKDKGGELAHGYTYSGHPVCAAVALENIRILQEEGIVERCRTETAPYLAQRWQELGQHRLVGEARIAGMVGALELVPDKSKRAFFAERGKVGVQCRDHALRNGLILRATYDAMLLSPPLIIDKAQIDEIFDKTWKALELTAAELGIK